ncbi:MAG TPA: alpha/beta family hydrolase [Gemmataceae bacterium]|nr:alpha/beta family hydrolase [Gemmataceae bacterium]
MCIRVETTAGHPDTHAAAVTLGGDLTIPANAVGIVLFAHGSGSSRHSPRNQFVARAIRERGVATLLFDLLTEEEEAQDDLTGRLRFDIGLLAGRLVAATKWIARQQETQKLGIGYFGASTGGAAALVAAAEIGPAIDAVVSRGGRPDLASEALESVQSPTLLIVGERDETVLELNRSAFDRLPCEKELKVITRATHLFEEPGALEQVARLAADWFRRRLRPR